MEIKDFQAWVGNLPADKLKPKKVRKSIDLSLWERLYIFEVLRGLAITSRHFFGNLVGFVVPPNGKKRKIPTIYYPEEKAVMPPAYRGRPVLVANPDGTERCVACGLCEKICPAFAISIIGDERANGDRYPSSYTLDLSRCIYCGYCEEVCPKEAIVMSDEYEGLCASRRRDMLYTKEQLLRPAAQLQKRIDYVRRIYAKCNY
ncbi:MAG: NADH-quinone oxidoreductase subunit I [Desulfobacteraceae bacterium]|nr:NADH-quinone oxidoreductase subunit I [Desulfobacteraceae bacterium]